MTTYHRMTSLKSVGPQYAQMLYFLGRPVGLLLLLWLGPVLHAQEIDGYGGRVHVSGTSTGQDSEQGFSSSWSFHDDMDVEIQVSQPPRRPHSYPIEGWDPATMWSGDLRGTYTMQGQWTRKWPDDPQSGCSIVETRTVRSTGEPLVAGVRLLRGLSLPRSSSNPKEPFQLLRVGNREQNDNLAGPQWRGNDLTRAAAQLTVGNFALLWMPGGRPNAKDQVQQKKKYYLGLSIELTLEEEHTIQVSGSSERCPPSSKNVEKTRLEHDFGFPQGHSLRPLPPSGSGIIEQVAFTYENEDIPFLTANGTYSGHIDISLCPKSSTTPKSPKVRVRFEDSNGAALASPLRLGITTPTKNRTQHLRAVVEPATEVKNVELSTTNNLKLLSKTIQDNTIRFAVVGIEKSTARGGDNLTATHCAERFSAPVSVVAPARLVPPQNPNSAPLEIRNWATGADTSPPHIGLPKIGRPPGFVQLITAYFKSLEITVHDQFNDPIGDLYEGAPITEYHGIPYEEIVGFPINQKLSASSTYVDPVGVTVPFSRIVVLADSQDVKDWPNKPPLPRTRPLTAFRQDIPVQVDGFPLNPGIVNRTITFTPPQTLIITWPQ